MTPPYDAPTPDAPPKRLSVLGSTGSIGTQALQVARWRGYEVVALAAGRNAARLIEQVRTFRPQLVSCDAAVADEVRAALPAGTQLAVGEPAAVAAHPADVVVAAIPGYAGLEPTLAALREGRHVALANKEAMVVAGPLVWETARAHGARLTPVDSELSALFQCLQGEPREAVAALVLTASGGPFRLAPEDLSGVSPAAALKHPTWNMGHKVTIDSATLFNKGLEVLESHFFFDWPLERIEVVIHPQSLVHSLVRFKDGNLKAQIGSHDMRLPIQVALEAPDRPPTPLAPLPLVGVWEFYEPDTARFPSLALAYEAGRRGGTAPAALNAADEVAVEAFLAGRIGFMDIPRALEHALTQVPHAALSWEAIPEADREARRAVRALFRL
ncbi:1-deoxy-D-xylulose-5-phosphate reductoisomerase [Truepera radiovictrix]|nr:1-deoxy-D-xylulose-5-phosphate reductoisomerase [Truepera radiovictrix]WMT57898.1 1-deoxy-D-xylulose-5-phosphate reductoisomerase [Truepera radiovictrix]